MHQPTMLHYVGLLSLAFQGGAASSAVGASKLGASAVAGQSRVGPTIMECVPGYRTCAFFSWAHFGPTVADPSLIHNLRRPLCSVLRSRTSTLTPLLDF